MVVFFPACSNLCYSIVLLSIFLYKMIEMGSDYSSKGKYSMNNVRNLLSTVHISTKSLLLVEIYAGSTKLRGSHLNFSQF